MSQPEFFATPWPVFPDYPHPEADPTVDWSRESETVDLIGCSTIARGILDKHKPKWKQIKNQHRWERRQIKLPLVLEGSATLIEEYHDGYSYYKVQKNQMGESTIWEWDLTGRLQDWRRSYLERSKADELMSTYFSGSGYDELILARLEDTLEELKLAKVNTKISEDLDLDPAIIIHRAMTDSRITEIFQKLKKMDTDKDENRRWALQEVYEIIEEIKAEYILSDEQIDEIRERVMAQIYAEEPHD